MATIVTRETGATAKNSVLTNQELDQNFINLNTDKLELAQTYSSAVANGIPYFNATKVLLTSSTFVFDGTNIGLGIDPIPYTSGNRVFEINGLSADSEIRLTNTATGHAAGVGGLSIRQTSQDSFIWNAGTGKLSLGAGNQSRLEISNTGVVTVGGNAVVTVGDTATVTNTMLAGSITNSKLVNSSITIGTTAISLGGTSTTLAGLTSVTSTSFVGALTGNASTATTLATARNINGVSFNGSSDITVADSTKLPLAGGTMTGIINLVSGTWAISNAPGSGTFNKHAWVASSTENVVEAALATDAVGGTKLPITLTWRGGYATQGGFKLTGSSTAELGGNTILHAGNVTSYVNNATLTMNVSGNGLSGSQTFTSNQGTAATFTVTSNATSANTASTLVFRDGSGNFSAGTITANLSGNATSVTNGVYTTSNVMLLRTGITDSTYNSATTTGLYTVSYTGYSRSLLVWNTGGSTGIVQLDVNYGDSGEIRLRNATDSATWSNWRTFLTNYNYNSYSPTLTGSGASGTWGIRITGFANQGSQRLYSTDSAYNYDSANPYFGYLTYDGSRWLFQVSPGTPAAVRVSYADSAGSASSATNITAYTINQSVGTGNSPTFSDIYTNGWFRNNNSGQGLYNQANGNHWYSDASNYWNITTGGAGGIRFRDAHASTIRGYVYSDTGNNIGFLNQNGSWAARVVGGDYWLVDGSSARAPIFYDSNDTTYYLDPNADLSLKVYGEISNSNYQSGNMQPGALNIGRTDTNYGWDGTTWSSDIRAGILANCSETWEFVIHDSGDSVESVFRYDGGDQLLMGRDIGWGNLYIEAASSFRAPLFYDSNNTGYYLDPASTSVLNRISTVRTNDWLYIDQNYGHSVVGVYASSRYQGVFAMGDSYKLPADGSTTGTLYGLAWSHPNAGGVAANLNTHGLLAMENGTWLASLTGSTRARDDMRAPIFYDNNNTGYYCDPNSSSYLYTLQLSGAGYFRPNNWIQFDSSYGIYWPNHYGAHLYANTGSTYTQIRIDGNKNSYGGIWDSYSAVNIGMFDGSGNGGVYREANGRWYIYYHLSNDCLGVGTSGSSSTYGIYCNKGIYANGRHDGTIFYDSENTGYYIDPNSTTAIRTVGDWRADAASWTGEFSGKIQYHSTHWYIQAAGGLQFRSSGGSQLLWCDQSGNLTATGNVTAYSDITLKKNVQTIQNPLSIVSRLRGVTFDWIETNKHSYGLIAQEVEQVLPELVQENIPDPNSIDRDKPIIKSVDYSKIVSVLIEAIKDQQSIINSQEDRLAKLEKLLGVNP